MSVSEPGKIITPWAESGLKNPIPPAANPATGRAGFDQGFSAINMTAKEAGGIPPFGQDFNGIFYEVTNILRYMQAGGQPTFDAALATAIGGYPKGAMVLGDDGVSAYTNKVDSNSSNPNSGGSGWAREDLMLREALRRSYAEAGYNVVGTFQSGFTIVNANDVGIDLATGKGYTGSAGFVSPGTDPTSGGFVDRSGVLLRTEVYRSRGDIRGWGATAGASADPAQNRAKIQQAVDESLMVYIPDSDGQPFLIDRPIRPNNFQTIFGPGEIKNITVYGTDTQDFIDTLVLRNKEIPGKVMSTIDNINTYGTRYTFIDYKAGDFYRLPLNNANTLFSVGEFVIIESTTFSGPNSLPEKSFVTKVSEVGAGYISLDLPHRLDIGTSTIRSMSGYILHEGITIKDVTLTASYYLVLGQFGGVGGIEGYNIRMDNVKMRGGIGYSINNMHRYVIENCEISTEFNAIEEALVSSNNTFRNNKISQRAGFVSDDFGVNGNQSSAAIMSAEGAGGGIYEGNEISGNWYIPIWCKSITTPHTVSGNTVIGKYYCAAYFFGAKTDVDFKNNTIKNAATGGFGVMAEPGVKMRSHFNNVATLGIGYIFNRAELNSIGDNITAPVKRRLTLASNASDTPSSFVTGDDSSELIQPVFYSSGSTVNISSLTNGELFTQGVNGNQVCQKGAAYELEAHFNFTSASSRTVTVNIGSTTHSFTVAGINVQIEAAIINSADGGSLGYGLGSVTLTCDGVAQQALITAYPTAVWNGSGVSVVVAGLGQVSGRFFKSTFRNNRCILLV